MTNLPDKLINLAKRDYFSLIASFNYCGKGAGGLRLGIKCNLGEGWHDISR
jgi:hypothetical protein